MESQEDLRLDMTGNKGNLNNCVIIRETNEERISRKEIEVITRLEENRLLNCKENEVGAM